jgi:hypothetical protein
VGFGAMVERENGINDGMEDFASNEIEDGEKFGFAAHVRAENGEMPAEKKTEIEFGVVSGGGAAGDEASAGGEAGEAVVPRGCADVLEDDVDAAMAVREALDVGLPTGLRMQDDVVGAERFRLFDFFLATDCGDDASAEHFRDLDARAADAAASAEDEDFFARLQFRARDEHVPRGEEHERHSGGFFERERFGKREHVARGSFYKFRAASIHQVAEQRVFSAEIVVASEAGVAVAAGNSRSENDFFADVNIVDQFSDGGDFAGDVAAWNVRHGNFHARNAAANPEIQVIDRTGAHTDENFVGARAGIGDFSDAENFGAAVLGEDNCFHESSQKININYQIKPGKVYSRSRAIDSGARIDRSEGPP